MKLKKLIALFLSVLMLLSVLPAALAEDATPQYGGMLTVLAMESNSMFPALSSTTSNRFNFSPAVKPLAAATRRPVTPSRGWRNPSPWMRMR